MARKKQSTETALVPRQPAAAPTNSQLTQKEVAIACAASGFFADSREAAQAIVKMEAARELGMGSMAGMTGIYIVKGRVSLSANVMAACIQRSGTHRFRVLKHTNKGCEIEFQERDTENKKWETVGVSSFNEDDAKLAGLTGGDNWRKYPRNMYYARAMSNGAKWYCPGVFAGNPPYTPDELGEDAEMTEEGDFIVKASSPSPLPPPASDETDSLVMLCRRAGSDPNQVAKYYKKASLSELSDDERKNAEGLLNAKLGV